MSLLTRLSRLFEADFHAVLDSIEEPIVLLGQAVRDMEESLSSDERRLAQLTREIEQLTDRRAGCARHAAQIAEELNVCFAAGHDELARGLLRRQLENARFDQGAAAQLELTLRSQQQLRLRIDENRPRLDAMRQKLALGAETAPADSRCGGAGQYAEHSAITEADIEIALLREKQRRAQP